MGSGASQLAAQLEAASNEDVAAALQGLSAENIVTLRGALSVQQYRTPANAAGRRLNKILSSDALKSFALHRAALDGDFSGLEMIVKGDDKLNIHCTLPDMTETDNATWYRRLSGITALHLAVFQRNLKCVETLLKAGARTDVDFVWEDSRRECDGPRAGREDKSEERYSAEDVADSEDMRNMLKSKEKVLSLSAKSAGDCNLCIACVSLDGSSVDVEIEATETLSTLKEMLANKFGGSARAFRLLVGDMEVNADTALYKIFPGIVDDALAAAAPAASPAQASAASPASPATPASAPAPAPAPASAPPQAASAAPAAPEGKEDGVKLVSIETLKSDFAASGNGAVVGLAYIRECLTGSKYGMSDDVVDAVVRAVAGKMDNDGAVPLDDAIAAVLATAPAFAEGKEDGVKLVSIETLKSDFAASGNGAVVGLAYIRQCLTGSKYGMSDDVVDAVVRAVAGKVDNDGAIPLDDAITAVLATAPAFGE